jgi:multidrug efflux system outer membrane protein
MNKRLFSAGLLVGVGVLSACVTKRSHYDTPEVALPASFRNTAKMAEDPLRKVSPLKSVLPDWWRLLNNPELNELVDRALANNHELRIATNRIAQAQARTKQARADQLPVFSLPYSANIAAPVEGVGLLPVGGEITSRRTYQAAVRADWRPDLWGEVQAMYETAELQMWRATFARDDVQRALTANVVSLYSNYLSLCDRLRIAEESESVLSGLLASVRERMNAGDATIIEFEQQRAAVFQVRATIPQLQLQRDQARNRLASLAGTVPGALHLSERGLDSYSYPVVTTGLPSALLLRRPDVRVLEATMLAADANIDTARARIFPQMDISMQYGVGGFAFSQLLQPARIFWSGLASLTTSIFDYGKRANEVAIARSVHEELLESYVQTLYNAVREVEDAQASVASNNKRLQVQQESVTAALSAWTYSRESYQAGAIDYMVLLDTERNYHARLDELNRIRLEHCLALVELFQALGGGVDSGASLPNQGKLALVEPPEVKVGLVQSVYTLDAATTVFGPTKLVDGDGKNWLAELPGMANYTSVLAMRRDLYARFPDLMTRQRIVLVRQEGRIADELNRERTSWYRMFIGAFPDADSSERFCAVLKSQFMRCNAMLNTSSAFASGGKWLQLGDAPQVAKAAPAPMPLFDIGQRPAMATARYDVVAPSALPPAALVVPEPVAALPAPLPVPAPGPAPEPAPVPAPPAVAANEAEPVIVNDAVKAFRLKLSHQITLPATELRVTPTLALTPVPPPQVQPLPVKPVPVQAPPAAVEPVAHTPPESVPLYAMATPSAPANILAPRAVPSMEMMATTTPSLSTPSMSAALAAVPRFTILAPVAPPVPAAAAAIAPASRIGYSVQVYSLQYAGRFTPEVIAGLKKRFAPSLTAWTERGYVPYLYKTELPGANLEIAICIGNFARSEDASLLAHQIRERGQAVATMVMPVELLDNGHPLALDAHMNRTAAAPAPAIPQSRYVQALTMTSSRQ